MLIRLQRTKLVRNISDGRMIAMIVRILLVSNHSIKVCFSLSLSILMEVSLRFRAIRFILCISSRVQCQSYVSSLRKILIFMSLLIRDTAQKHVLKQVSHLKRLSILRHAETKRMSMHQVTIVSVSLLSIHLRTSKFLLDWVSKIPSPLN